MKSNQPTLISDASAFASRGKQTVARTRLDWHQSRSLITFYTVISSWVVVQVGFWLTPYDTNLIRGHLGPYATGVTYAAIAPLFAYIMNLDDSRRIRSTMALTVGCLAWCGISCLALVMVVYGVFYAALGRWIVVGIFALSVLASLPLRLLIKRLAEKHKRRILIVAGVTPSHRVGERLGNFMLPFEVVMLVPGEKEEQMAAAESIKELCLRLGISEVVLAHDTQLSKEKRSVLVEDCVFAGISVCTESVFFERHLQLIPIEAVGTDWLENLDLKIHHPLYHNVKRAVDVLLSAALLVLSGPIIIFAMSCIAMIDGRPVILKQNRVGLYGRPFQMLKLRTMRRVPADTKPVWTEIDDRRLLPLGGYFRRLRIDELPQLINVLRGTMTLIGPRPEIPSLNKEIVDAIPQFRFRYCVKPGLTGWAQINLPYGADIAGARAKLEFDLFYIGNRSLLLDIQIILRTIGGWMFGAR